MTTPAQVRNLLKKHKLPFGLSKADGCWFVTGEETHLWFETSLNTFSFHGLSAEEWVEDICQLSMKNREKVLESLATIEEPEWKKTVEETIKAVDGYFDWKGQTAKAV
jgi:hypothetical protein